MHSTFDRLLAKRAHNPELLIKATSVGMIQIATMMSELYKTLNFNHRDFKTDNCMYMYDEQGRIQMRLIDFGLSYIQYKKTTIITSGYNFKEDALPSRDMTQFMYELYIDHDYLPKSLLTVLEDLLTFPHNNSVCKMYKGCEDMQSWRNSYNFLNSNKTMNPNGEADIVKNVFIKVYNGLDYKSELAYAPGLMGLFVAKPAVPLVGPKGKIYNPDTGRWVDADGPIGKRLLKEIDAVRPEDKVAVAEGLAVKICPPEKPDYNPKTKRCVKACDAGKKRNTTFKCVKK